jgi:hypothetical protein
MMGAVLSAYVCLVVFTLHAMRKDAFCFSTCSDFGSAAPAMLEDYDVPHIFQHDLFSVLGMLPVYIFSCSQSYAALNWLLSNIIIRVQQSCGFCPGLYSSNFIDLIVHHHIATTSKAHMFQTFSSAARVLHCTKCCVWMVVQAACVLNICSVYSMFTLT